MADNAGRTVRIPSDQASLTGDLNAPAGARLLVIFAHGSGSSRLSPRNRAVARVLNDAGLATLLLDLLTPSEEAIDSRTAEHRFDIELLSRRLCAAIAWSRQSVETKQLAVGLFGASTGAAAALVAAARTGAEVCAVVSRGGRPDLAGSALRRVQAPTLLIVGSYDTAVLDLNRSAYECLRCPKSLLVVPGATHLFEEPGALEFVAKSARDWFECHVPPEPMEETSCS